MRHLTVRRLLFAFLLAMALAVATSAVLAQTGGGFDLSWNSIDGGGGVSTGGAYSLSGDIGQWDAGAMSGGAYTLEGGFMAGASSPIYRVYLPVILVNYGG